LGEAVVGAGLLVPVADFNGDGECRRVLSSRVVGLSTRAESLAYVVECAGFAAAVADPSVEGEGLLVVVSGLLVAALPAVNGAKVVQRVGFAVTGADLPVEVRACWWWSTACW